MRAPLSALVLLAALAGTAHAQDRRFTAVIDVQPDTTDPAMTHSSPNVVPVFANIEDGLVAASHEGKDVPGIATWKTTDEGHTITFTIKPGIKFQNGDPLTADDVIFSHQRALANVVAYRQDTAGLDHVEKVDEHTVRFVFKTPNIGLITQHSLYIGDKAYHDRVGEQEYIAHPIGTGPYKLTDYKLGQYFDLDAWDGWWGGKPAIQHARIRVVADTTTAVQMLRAGEADIVFDTPYNQVGPLQAAGFGIAKARTFPTIAINFQMYDRDTPWAKPKVREAIAHAIDNAAIVKGLLNGVPSNDGLLTPGERGYSTALGPYSYDPALAKKLLAEAGYPNGFTMPYYVPNNYYGQRETGEAVTLYLKQVGITADVKQMDSVQVNNLLISRGKDPTLQFVYQRSMPLANNGDPAVAMSYVFNPASATDLFRTDNPAFEPLLDQARATPDEAARDGLVTKALSIVHDEYGVIPIWNAVTVYAFNAKYGFTPTQHELPRMELAAVTIKK